MTEINLGWFGFWIMVAITEAAWNWHSFKMKELQLKYKVRFRWWDGKITEVKK